MTRLVKREKVVGNISTLPVSAKMLVKSKLMFTSLVSSIGLGLGAVVSALFFAPRCSLFSGS